MNRILCVFILTLLSQIGMAMSLEAYNPATKKYEKIEVRKYQELRLTNCSKAKVPKCQAWTAANKIKQKATSPENLTAHPAANYCSAVGGMGRVYKDKNGDVDYCVFKDNSGVDAWDLYYKHHGK